MGYHVVRIPGLLSLPNGVVLASGEARRGGGGDWDDNDILVRRSEDNGETWQAPSCVVANATYGPGPVSNFSMFYDSFDGAVHAVFCHKYERIFVIRSDDSGKELVDASRDHRGTGGVSQGVSVGGARDGAGSWNPASQRPHARSTLDVRRDGI